MTMTDALHLFLGHSASGQAVRHYDWAHTPLGPINDWSHSLRTMVGAVLDSAFPQCLVWGPQHIMIYNDAFQPILGNKPAALGRPFGAVWSEAWQMIEPLVERAYAGEPTFIEDYPLMVERRGRPEQAYFTFCYSPIRDDDGRVAGMLDTVIETTPKMQAQQQASLINTELAHRIQNTLAIVNSICDQTFRAASSLDEARITFSRRLKALGQAQMVLTQSSWISAPMAAIIEGALVPHSTAPGEICAQGPPVNLSARQALSLGMAIHELATNSMKYGALSAAGGEVAVRWSLEPIDSDQCLRLRWAESGGPPVSPPKRRGFGSLLIEQVLAQDFGGKVSLSYEPDGLRFELATKLSNLPDQGTRVGV
ncbi:sensor histidine kinase [Steroidobacter cummioxidans]|uniref:sensor histidine kinase n=1 Tax=Steroidobacter cummioxidans TaxID=1803913 RepID=UPI0019D490A7|nr:PAS domain-containing sensor histidine kinase [Steroidobacter cummioxidans]